MPKKASTASQKARAAARTGTKYTTAFRQHSARKPSARTRLTPLASEWDDLVRTAALGVEPVDLSALLLRV